MILQDLAGSIESAISTKVDKTKCKTREVARNVYYCLCQDLITAIQAHGLYPTPDNALLPRYAPQLDEIWTLVNTPKLRVSKKDANKCKHILEGMMKDGKNFSTGCKTKFQLKHFLEGTLDQSLLVLAILFYHNHICNNYLTTVKTTPILRGGNCTKVSEINTTTPLFNIWMLPDKAIEPIQSTNIGDFQLLNATDPLPQLRTLDACLHSLLTITDESLKDHNSSMEKGALWAAWNRDYKGEDAFLLHWVEPEEEAQPSPPTRREAKNKNKEKEKKKGKKDGKEKKKPSNKKESTQKRKAQSSGRGKQPKRAKNDDDSSYSEESEQEDDEMEDVPDEVTPIKKVVEYLQNGPQTVNRDNIISKLFEAVPGLEDLLVEPIPDNIDQKYIVDKLAKVERDYSCLSLLQEASEDDVMVAFGLSEKPFTLGGMRYAKKRVLFNVDNIHLLFESYHGLTGSTIPPQIQAIIDLFKIITRKEWVTSLDDKERSPSPGHSLVVIAPKYIGDRYVQGIKASDDSVSSSSSSE